MQVSVFTIGQKTKKYMYYTRKPINWLLKIFALSYNVQQKTHFNTKGSFLRIFITVGIFGLYNFTSFYKKMYFNAQDLGISNSMQLMDLIQNIFDFCQYVVDVFFVYKYGREESLEYFRQYETVDKILGSAYHHSPIRSSLTRLTCFFIFIWTASSSCDFVVWGLRTKWIVPAVYAVTYLFMFVKILTTLDLISHVMHIECRLRIMGDLMQYCHTSAESMRLPQETLKIKWFHCSTAIALVEIEKHIQHLKSHALNGYNEFNWFIRCYLMLAEQSAFINSMCGIRILLNSTSLLISMVTYSNLAVGLIIIGSKKTEDAFLMEYFPALSSLIRVGTCAALLISLVHHCERVYRQRERIICIIDHMLYTKNLSADLMATLKDFRGVVETRPIYFHMANLVRLQYSLLVSTASVVVTYTIILVQNTI